MLDLSLAHYERLVHTFTWILYYTLFPAVVAVPWWFLHGRVCMGGNSDFYGSFMLGNLCIYGIIFFHILIAGWELSRPKHQRSTFIAVALLCVYGLHVCFQIFFFDENSNHQDGWSVASKYWGISRETSMSTSWILGLLIWTLMVVVLLKSFWTVYPNQDSVSPQPFDSDLIRQRMKDTLKPSTVLVWLWFGLGHSVLGAGVGWGVMNLLVLGAPILIPFHTIVWYRERLCETVSKEMALALMVYYALQFGCQIFEWEGFRTGESAASMYFGIPSEASDYITWGFYAAILIMMIYIMVLSCCDKHPPFPSVAEFHYQALNQELVQG